MFKWYQDLPDYIRYFIQLAVIVFLMWCIVWFF